MDEKQQKHSTIDELTDNLSVSVRGLENLVIKVSGEPVTDDGVAKAELKQISLEKFLAEYPKRIEDLNERITIATNALREKLF